MPSWPTPNVSSMATTTLQATAQTTVKSATDVVTTTTSQPYARENPKDHPKEAEPSLPEMQAHHPNENTTSPAAGARLAAHPDHPPADTAECLPTAPII